MDDKVMENHGHELGVFLARKFLLVMVFIFFSEQAVTAIYHYALVPLLTNVMQVEQIQIHGESIRGTLVLIMKPLWTVISDAFPGFIAKPAEAWINAHSAAAYAAPDFILSYGPLMVKMYYRTILMLLLIQLILALVPYIAAGWWYVHQISVKMNELRERDAQIKADFDRRRNLLFSDITHDIKTPITSIVGYSKALTDGLVTDPVRQDDYLRTIYSKSLRISDLISMLFEFVKLGSDGFELHTERLDLAELVRENVIMLLEDYDAKHIDLEIDIPDQTCMVEADRLQMARVVTNLLTNSIRYIDQGHKVQVKMTIDESGDHALYRIYVADDGLPIDEAFAETIFDPFSRSDAARQTTSGGSGLGLSIAHKVAAMHGGQLRLDLGYGQGYEKAFILEVPGIGQDRP